MCAGVCVMCMREWCVYVCVMCMCAVCVFVLCALCVMCGGNELDCGATFSLCLYEFSLK